MASRAPGRSAGEAGGARAAVPASLAFEGVSCSYGDFDALRDVSFRIEGPVKVGVIGASGSGKSTLLSLIGGVREPDAGDVLIDGSSAASLKRELARPRRVHPPGSLSVPCDAA